MKSTPQFSVQSLSLFQQKWMINTILHNSKPFFPALTSLEEEMAALFIAKTGNLAQGGAITKERETAAACGVNLSLILVYLSLI